MKILYSIILLFLLPLISNGDNLIIKVKDINNNNIPFANIFIKDLKVNNITDENGVFEIKNITLREYKIQVSAVNYKPKTLKINLSSNKKNNISIILEAEKNLLKEVVVENKGKQEEIFAKGLTANIINLKKIKTQSIDINQVITQTSGIQVRQSAGLGSRANFNINGLGGNAVKIFIDDIPSELYGSSYSVNNIPISMVERIDIYKGVVPTELGGDALGGAINIITNKNSINSLNVSYSVGSFNTHKVSIDGVWNIPKYDAFVRFSGFYNYSDNNYWVWGNHIYVSDSLGQVKRGLKVRRFNDGFKSFSPKLDLGIRNKKWADKLIFSLLYADLYKESQHGSTMQVPYGDRFYTSNTLTPTLFYNKKDIIKGMDLSLFGSVSNLDRRVVDTSSIRYNWYGEPFSRWTEGGEAGVKSLTTDKITNDIQRINIKQKLTEFHSLGLNGLRSGNLMTVVDELHGNSDKSNLASRKLTATNINFSHNFSTSEEKFNINTFAKLYLYDINVDDFDYTGEERKTINFKKNEYYLGYGNYSSLSIIEDLRIMFSYELAFRLPSVNEVFGNVSENVISSYNLEPEKSNNINLGIQWKYGNDIHKVNIFTNLFIRDTYNQILSISSFGNSNGDNTSNINIGKVFSKGIDTEIKYNFIDRLNYSISASYLDARNRMEYDEFGQKNSYYNVRLRNLPYLQYNQQLSFNFVNLFKKKGIFNIKINNNYIHEFSFDWENFGNTNQIIIPSQMVFDMGCSYSEKNRNWSISFDIRNITDQQVFDNFASQKPGRSFFMKFNYKIM